MIAQPAEGPELFFGLVGAVGTDIGVVSDQLALELHRVGYAAQPVRLSQLLADLSCFADLKDTYGGPEDQRIDRHMNAGNSLRRKMSAGNAVARLAMNEIRSIRYQFSGEPDKPSGKRAFILNSLKHPDEAHALRETYGPAFYLVSIYQPINERIDSLISKIQSSRERIARAITGDAQEAYKNAAIALVNKDAKQIDDPYGQSLRDIFPLADLFVSVGPSLHDQVRRFVEILFGARFHTPTIDEFGVFHASAAAVRSADVSRQVGAVVMTQDGCILANGCNEVPLPKGGHFWPGYHPVDRDNRDFREGRDATAEMKHEIVAEIFEALGNGGEQESWLREDLRNQTDVDLTHMALYEGKEPVFRHTRVAGILEFGRIVHAEMSALMDAARRGIKVDGATVYCTTFPCHMCARHIVAGGIGRVVYVEPYPKSLAKRLYPNAIRVEHDEAGKEAISFEPFIGIAPRKYMSFFEKLDRKGGKPGQVLSEQHLDATPRFVNQFPIYFDLEAGYAETLEGEGLIEPSQQGSDGNE